MGPAACAAGPVSFRRVNPGNLAAVGSGTARHSGRMEPRRRPQCHRPRAATVKLLSHNARAPSAPVSRRSELKPRCRFRAPIAVGLCILSAMVSGAPALGEAPSRAQEPAKLRNPERFRALSRPARTPPALVAPPVQPTKESGDLEIPIASGDPTRAAPANDACANAQMIMGIGTFPYNNSEATTDGADHFACSSFFQSQISRDIWFRWTATATASFTLETCALTATDSRIAVYHSAPCPPGDASLIGCNDDACGTQSRLSFNAINGTQYLIRVGVFPGTPGGSGSLLISFQSGQNLCTFPASNCQPKQNTAAYDSTGRLVRDDFTVTATSNISSVCFFGTYFDGVSACPGQQADRFTITYYYDFFGTPDVDFPIASFSTTDATLMVTGPVPTGALVAGLTPEYQYTAIHEPLFVEDGTCYWIEIFNDLEGQVCAWYWERGTNGNGIAFQDSMPLASDLAFCFNTALNPSTLCQTAAPPSHDECAAAANFQCNSVVTAQNVFATTSPSDPIFPCRVEGAQQGVGTLWYKFIASSTSAQVNTCPTRSGDSLVAVYSGTCGNLTQIGCNDDSCGLRSTLCVSGLMVGQTYYIQFATYSGARGAYTMALTCPCPTGEYNDTCATADTMNPAGGFDGRLGSTELAFVDENAPECSFNAVTAPGVWYRVVGNGTTFTANVCNAEYDSKIHIYCGTCDALICVGNNDDGTGEDECGPGASGSFFQWCTEPGRTYYILVSGFSGQVGDFSIFMNSDFMQCSPPPACNQCSLQCPAGPAAILENEPCGGDTNGGCNAVPEAFMAIQPGQTVCGTAPASAAIRDTDWFEFSIGVTSVVTWSVQAELEVEVFILDDQCPPTTLGGAAAERCGAPGVVSLTLDAGTYRAFVSPIGDAYPCGSTADYQATLTAVPVGACCTSTDCVRTTAMACAGMSGVYAGDGTECPTVYTASTCAGAFEDISVTGTPLPLSNDASESVPLGFSFRFYGVDRTDVLVSSNGYLTFGTPGDEPVNSPIPSAAPPNAIIAPLWDDYAPNAGGSVQFEVRDTAPNRRFIAQWSGIPRFLASDSNTFQAILFEGTNCIEFRYGAFTPIGPGRDATVGVEKHTGTIGTSVDPATLSMGSCVRLCASGLAPDACEPPGCDGDADLNGEVDFNDILAVLANWGGSGPVGDADRNSAVNFNDILSVLANWGCGVNSVCMGDANRNGSVSFDDVLTVLANMGGTGPNGDADYDGSVDFDDVLTVLANMGATCG